MSFDLPRLPRGWAFTALEQCAVPGSISYGVVQPGVPVETGIPIIRVNNFGEGRLDLSDVLRIAPEIESKYTRTRLSGGEVLLTLVGSVGQVAEVPSNCAGFNVARAVGVIKPAKGIEAKWLAICLRSPLSQHLLGSRANTTVQTTINLKDVRALPIPIPPAAERTLIAEMIGALDSRIALLRETNFTVEAIAQALFKSWFVDFDPVRAKSRGLPPAGMDEATAALFPDSFDESASGLMPAGWRRIPFGQLLCHTIGGDWGSDFPDESNDTKVAIIRGTDIPDLQSGERDRVPIRYTTKKKLAARSLQDGDLILEVSGGSKDQPTGRAIYLTKQLLDRFGSPAEPASFCRLLRPASKELGVVLAQHLTYIYSQGKTWEYQNQSTGISNFQTKRFLENEMVSIPSEMVLALFSATVRPMVDRAHLTQAKELASLRDTLLPRLISGQLRLPEAAERVTETST